MAEKLPVLISIPHGGRVIPEELMDKTPLTPRDVFEDGDPLTRDIYNFNDRVKALIAADVGRAFVDLNRKASDLPPENPDGVLKLHTLAAKPVYKKGDFPGPALQQTLLDRYYHPYHQTIARYQGQHGIKLGLDCHSMLPKPPFFSTSPEKKRPMICLSNSGDTKGESTGDRQLTCPPQWVRTFAECLKKSFSREKGDVLINTPFRGGHISTHHSRTTFPWIQVELNRDLYLSRPWYDEENQHVSTERIALLNAMIFEAIRSWIRSIYL